VLRSSRVAASLRLHYHPQQQRLLET